MNISDALERMRVYMQASEFRKSKALPSLPAVVEEARQEWLNAQYYYNTVTDQDLIDHAVYLMQAAEKKYMYLLKQARSAGVEYSPYRMNAEVDIDKKEVLPQ